jgi:hypothetical protein
LVLASPEVWAKCGGDAGYWSGKEVADQFRFAQEFWTWRAKQDDFVAEQAKLQHPIKRVQVCIHTDRSLAHLCHKDDGIIIGKFNKSATKRSNTNAKAAVRCCCPRGIALSEGDFDPDNCNFQVGDIYSFKLTEDSYKGLQQVAEELGWATRGMRLSAKAKKKKVPRNDLFVDRNTKELVRVMKVTPDANGGVHKKFSDMQGTIIARPFIFADGAVPQYTLHTRNVYDRPMLESQCAYVRPSSITDTNGALSQHAGLRVFVGQSQAVVSGSDPSPAALKKLASSPGCVTYNLGTGVGYSVLEG